ncbi:MAG: hypothetical protein JXA28_11855 [Bacteroidetes bacterium]|nr:hypothetical protein [Bacteroidota bacterium]
MDSSAQVSLVPRSVREHRCDRSGNMAGTLDAERPVSRSAAERWNERGYITLSLS